MKNVAKLMPVSALRDRELTATCQSSIGCVYTGRRTKREKRHNTRQAASHALMADERARLDDAHLRKMWGEAITNAVLSERGKLDISAESSPPRMTTRYRWWAASRRAFPVPLNWPRATRLMPSLLPADAC